MVRKAVLALACVLLAVVAAPAQARDTVVGGDLAPDGRFPWMVRLSVGCGGTLVAPRVVLTAGHCVAGTGPQTGIKVTAGVTDLKSPRAITARSVSVIRAAGFQGETKGDDWAVIRLDRALTLPTLELSAAPGPAAGRFTVLGWGLTRETATKQQRRLRFAEVPIVPDVTCAKAYRKVKVQLVADEQVCAAGKGVDTCQGDSGGPMVGKNAKGRWVQVGIVSWGLGCARAGYPGVYTQIATFRPAILAAVHKLR